MNPQELGRLLELVLSKSHEVLLDHNLRLTINNSSLCASLAYVRKVQESGLSAISRAVNLIPIQDCDISLTLFSPPKSRKDVGVSDPCVNGFAKNDGVFININSLSPVFEEIHTVRLQGVIAHELHHVVRMRGPGIEETLLEKLVREGLAMCFSEDYFGDKPNFPCFVTPLEGIESYWHRIKDRVFTKNEEGIPHGRWFGPFFAVQGWGLGYPLGHHFIRSYLRAHPNETSASLVQAPMERFIE